MTQYCYSKSGEDFRDITPEELFAEMMDEETFELGATYWRGEVRKPKAQEFFNIQRLIEEATDNAYEEGGDYAEDFAQDIPPEALNELETFIANWANLHCPVNFFSVHAPVEMKVTDEEYADFMCGDNQ